VSDKDQIVAEGVRPDSERETADEADILDADADPDADDDEGPGAANGGLSPLAGAARPGADRPDSEDDDQTAVISLAALGSRQPDRDWAFGSLDAESAGFGPEPGSTSEAFVSFISLGFIGAALRRGMKVWVTLALVGLVGGLGALVLVPPAQQASTTLLLQGPSDAPAGEQIADDQSMITSRTIAADAITRLHLNEAPQVLLKDYTATVVTNQILTISVKAKVMATAIREANALAQTFLKFQIAYLNNTNSLADAADRQQLASAQAALAALGNRISGLKANPATARSPELKGLEAQYTQADDALTVADSDDLSTEASNQTSNAAIIAGSKVLDAAAPVKQSKAKNIALYVGGGLVAGLVIGMAIVIVGGLVSDRLRRRDDVARILGSPVRFSVGPITTHRWLPGRKGMSLSRHRDVQRISAHLGNAVAHNTTGPASLAVVPVDDPQIPAVSLVSLAVSCAQQGLKAVVADMCVGAPAARLLKATRPGVQEVSARGTTLTVIRPDQDDVPISGPLRKPRWARVPEPVLKACASADVILVLATVDPALGAEYLAGWVTSVVAVVTAGRASAQRVFAVGEMLRLAGIQSVSAVLVGADKSDESLGVVPGAVASREPEPAMNGIFGGNGSFLAGASQDLTADSAGQIALSNGTTSST
jgi:capsular polysaccharide biosynthesis protein